jgi:hypothetical protein
MVRLVAVWALLMPLGATTVQVTTVRDEAMPVRCEVELDIFSGEPNPTWALSDAETDSFAKQLAALRQTAPRQLSGRLGYRGFIVQCTEGTGVWSVHLQDGVAHISRGTPSYADDQQRRLERWLLNTGKPHLRPDLFEFAERELR